MGFEALQSGGRRSWGRRLQGRRFEGGGRTGCRLEAARAAWVAGAGDYKAAVLDATLAACVAGAGDYKAQDVEAVRAASVGTIGCKAAVVEAVRAALSGAGGCKVSGSDCIAVRQRPWRKVPNLESAYSIAASVARSHCGKEERWWSLSFVVQFTSASLRTVSDVASAISSF